MSQTNITHRPTTQVSRSPYCRIDIRDPNPVSGNLVLLHPNIIRTSHRLSWGHVFLPNLNQS